MRCQELHPKGKEVCVCRQTKQGQLLAIKINASQIHCSSLKQQQAHGQGRCGLFLPDFPKGFAKVQEGLFKKLNSLRKVPSRQGNDGRDKGLHFSAGFIVRLLLIDVSKRSAKMEVAKAAHENKGAKDKVLLMVLLPPSDCRRKRTGNSLEMFVQCCRWRKQSHLCELCWAPS